jgi:dipeptidyl-peptidase-4
MLSTVHHISFDKKASTDLFSPHSIKTMNKVTLFLCALLVQLSLTTTAQKKITNELIWESPEFSGEFFAGLNSMNDGMHYSLMDQSDAFGTTIEKYSYATGQKVETIATSKTIFGNAEKGFDDYAFSADESKIVIVTDFEPIYRYSFYANYFIHDLKTGKTIQLTDFKKGKQRLADFSPDGNKVAFVRDNNLFYLDIPSMQEIQITRDGEKNTIINGATDWVYEEEFAVVKGFEWSPKGDRLAYYRFDESQVKEFGMDIYGELYPDRYTFKYPKAGERNSTIQLFIYECVGEANRMVNIGTETDIYIPRIKWTKNNDKLFVMRMNRHQNHLEFLATDLAKTQPYEVETTVVYDEKADTYIDVNDALTFLSNGSGFIWNSEKDNYNHLYLFDINGKQLSQLTSGNWDVIDFYGIDESTSTIYYSSSQEGATEKHVYSLAYTRKKPAAVKLSTKSGSNDATFSEGFKYYLMSNSDASTPLNITLFDQKGKEIRKVVTNDALKGRLKEYTLAKKEFFTFKNSEGIDLNCWMMKPANFDAKKKYPVIVAIYGGPGHNTVVNQWEGKGYMWHQLMCQESYIVVSVDPRGTQYRGRAFKHATYMNLGKAETNDFIDFAKYLQTQSYVDGSRIGMQGWSYGGYMTSLCMTKGADFYKTGIAVAPVTNWKYYDSIYTERFMRTPQENEGGYENNSPINFTDLLKGKYLIIHGSADDNVHYQNTMDMVTALVKSNTPFDMFIYPNKNHGIYGGHTRLHLYTKMTEYFKANL